MKMILEFRVMKFTRNPRIILKELGLSSCEFWEKGKPRYPYELGTFYSPKVHKENGFSIAADKRCKTFEKCASKLVEKAFLLKKQLKRTCGNYHAELSCVIQMDDHEERFPSIHFSAETLNQLAELKAEIDVDVY